MRLFKFILTIYLLQLSYELKGMDLVGFDKEGVETTSKWQFITDKVMGGNSTGNLQFFFDNFPFIRMEGTVSTENKGGFIQFRSDIDISKDNFSSIEINVRGNPETYYVHIRTHMTIFPWQYYACEFSVNENWKKISLKLNDFKKSNFYQPSEFDSSDIKSIAFVAFGKDFNARLDLKSAYLTK